MILFVIGLFTVWFPWLLYDRKAWRFDRELLKLMKQAFGEEQDTHPSQEREPQ